MRFEGKCMQCSMLEGGVAELRLDLQADSVNKFNRDTLAELTEAVALIKAEPGVRGLLVTSGKDCFVVGADVTEFLAYFKYPEEQLTRWLLQVDQLSFLTHPVYVTTADAGWLFASTLFAVRVERLATMGSRGFRASDRASTKMGSHVLMWCLRRLARASTSPFVANSMIL